MITVRIETKKDYPVIYEVNKLGFNRENEAKLVDNLRKSSGFIPELSLVAIKDGKIVGHILFSKVRIKNDKGEITVLTLAPIAVLPKHQRQGIGSLLIKKGLAACKELGWNVIVTIGHPDYYPRFGFTPARQKGLEISFKDPIPDEAFMVCELKSGALKDIEGTVELPPVFEEAT